jgi:hypothetical protein
MAEKKPAKKKLSIRERKFIKGLIEGKSPSKAMVDAGYTQYTAWAKAKEKVKEVQVSETIQALMEKRGISDDRLTEVLEKGLEATKVISALIIAKDGEGMKDANSMTRDFVDVEDYAIRHKYLETGLKLKGHLRDKIDLTHGNPDGSPINITITFVGVKNA